MRRKEQYVNKRRIIEQTISYRILILITNFFLFTVILQSPQEAGFLTIIRQGIQTILYAINEYLWANVFWDTTQTGKHKRTRSFIKAIFFRIVTIISDMILLLSIAQLTFSDAFTNTLLITIINTMLYYIHDRIWDSVKIKKPR